MAYSMTENCEFVINGKDDEFEAIEFSESDGALLMSIWEESGTINTTQGDHHEDHEYCNDEMRIISLMQSLEEEIKLPYSMDGCDSSKKNLHSDHVGQVGVHNFLASYDYNYNDDHMIYNAIEVSSSSPFDHECDRDYNMESLIDFCGDVGEHNYLQNSFEVSLEEHDINGTLNLWQEQYCNYQEL